MEIKKQDLDFILKAKKGVCVKAYYSDDCKDEKVVHITLIKGRYSVYAYNIELEESVIIEVSDDLKYLEEKYVESKRKGWEDIVDEEENVRIWYFDEEERKAKKICIKG